MQKNKTKNGFTLAEILTTLCIMGFVMAVTIPNLMQTTYKNTCVDGLKKTYGVLDQATTQIMSNNSGTLISAFSSSTDLQTKFGNILEYNQICSTGSVTGNCWASSTLPLFGGTIQESFNANTNYTGAVLADGTDLLFYLTNPTCNGTGVSIVSPYASNTQTYLCGYIIADVNGFAKGPNQFGRDIFIFLLGSNGLYKGGSLYTKYYDPTVDCSTSNTTHNGDGCADVVLNAQAINY